MEKSGGGRGLSKLMMVIGKVRCLQENQYAYAPMGRGVGGGVLLGCFNVVDKVFTKCNRGTLNWKRKKGETEEKKKVKCMPRERCGAWAEGIRGRGKHERGEHWMEMARG